MMKNQQAGVVILGAGIQGCCIALELAQQGVEVTLLDRDETPMNRASLRNEGKIHLGLIYANDRTNATGSLMLKGALHFHPLLKRWLGAAIEQLRYSTPFYYLVAKDSIMTPAELATHYDSVESCYKKLLQENPDLNYLGQTPDCLYQPLTQDRMAAHFQPDQFLAGFETAELAIDTDRLARVIRDAIAHHPNIQFLPHRRVKTVERTNGLLRIEGTSGEETWRIDASQVVNATWENRLAIDRTIGLESAPGWLHRLKYRVIVRVPETLRLAPSATMIIGRYGDVVIRKDGTAYLSWYPLALQGWTEDLSPPESWNAPCRGETDPVKAQQLARGVIAEIDRWFPGIGDGEVLLVDAGAIFAYGHTDVDDAASGLHDRTRIGVTSVEGYHSVDSGKLTTAPLFAVSAAERIMQGF